MVVVGGGIIACAYRIQDKGRPPKIKCSKIQKVKTYWLYDREDTVMGINDLSRRYSKKMKYIRLERSFPLVPRGLMQFSQDSLGGGRNDQRDFQISREAD